MLLNTYAGGSNTALCFPSDKCPDLNFSSIVAHDASSAPSRLGFGLQGGLSVMGFIYQVRRLQATAATLRVVDESLHLSADTPKDSGGSLGVLSRWFPKWLGGSAI